MLLASIPLTPNEIGSWADLLAAKGAYVGMVLLALVAVFLYYRKARAHDEILQREYKHQEELREIHRQQQAEMQQMHAVHREELRQRDDKMLPILEELLRVIYKWERLRKHESSTRRTHATHGKRRGGPTGGGSPASDT